MNSKITGERFILVAKNLSYKDILSHITSTMEKKAPSKELKLWQLQLGKFGDQIRNIVTGKARTITNSTIYGLQHPTKFDNSKISKALEFEFEPLDETIEFSSKLFIEENS